MPSYDFTLKLYQKFGLSFELLAYTNQFNKSSTTVNIFTPTYRAADSQTGLTASHRDHTAMVSNMAPQYLDTEDNFDEEEIDFSGEPHINVDSPARRWGEWSEH